MRNFLNTHTHTHLHNTVFNFVKECFSLGYINSTQVSRESSAYYFVYNKPNYRDDGGGNGGQAKANIRSKGGRG